MNSFNEHDNLSQHASEPRSPSTVCQSVHGHAGSTNRSMSILIASIKSILSIYFKSQRALVFIQSIYVNIYHIYSGFFSLKLHYNNNQYKQTRIYIIFDTFGGGSNASCRIKLYGLIFGSEYVYVVYFLNPNGRHVTFLW